MNYDESIYKEKSEQAGAENLVCFRHFTISQLRL